MKVSVVCIDEKSTQFTNESTEETESGAFKLRIIIQITETECYTIPEKSLQTRFELWIRNNEYISEKLLLNSNCWMQFLQKISL